MKKKLQHDNDNINKSKLVLLIPSLNPDEKFVKLIDELNENDYNNIIVVNDGSNNDSKKYFKEVERKVTIILNHAVNLGKGRALKTGFNYFLEKFPEAIGIITLDADGQHSVNDINKIAKNLNEKKMILRFKKFR